MMSNSGYKYRTISGKRTGSRLWLFICLFVVAPASFAQQNSSPSALWRVVIDPGHGGKDPGALGKVHMEKDLTLAISLKLGEYIEKYFDDVEVIYTRKTDQFVELHERARIANAAKADLFISIHTNANVSAAPFGSSTYVMGLAKTKDNLNVATQENKVIQLEDKTHATYENFDPSSEESRILFALMQDSYYDQSIELATYIQNQMRTRARRHDRGVKQANLYVLWSTGMPSVLVETGFITNETEEQFLGSEYGQETIATAIFRAFREYKVQVENRSDFLAQRQAYRQVQVPASTSTGGATSTVTASTNTSQTAQTTTQTKPVTPTTNPATGSGSDIVFKVQLCASNKQMAANAALFKGIKDIEEVQIQGVYKYMTGTTGSYDQIVALQKQIKTKIPDAFIVVFQNGNRIPIQDALDILRQ